MLAYKYTRFARQAAYSLRLFCLKSLYHMIPFLFVYGAVSFCYTGKKDEGVRRVIKKRPLPYDREQDEPVLRSSICTGEQVAGFCNRQTGRFREVMLIRGQDDLRRFCRQYGIQGPLRKIY